MEETAIKVQDVKKKEYLCATLSQTNLSLV